MEKEKLKCEVCGCENDTVKVIFCGYSQEIEGTDVEETICEKCEYEHLMDI